ncbi:MAG: hypothetical protein M1114_02870 [Candidatus Dependentiae bacterium]|nr:hypothetical protein [Candidatus Dependentiae bacterium]
MKKYLILFLFFILGNNCAERIKELSCREKISLFEGLMQDKYTVDQTSIIVPDYKKRKTTTYSIPLTALRTIFAELDKIIQESTLDGRLEESILTKALSATDFLPDLKSVEEIESADPIISDNPTLSRDIMHLRYLQNKEYYLASVIKAFVTRLFMSTIFEEQPYKKLLKKSLYARKNIQSLEIESILKQSIPTTIPLSRCSERRRSERNREIAVEIFSCIEKINSTYQFTPQNAKVVLDETRKAWNVYQKLNPAKEFTITSLDSKEATAFLEQMRELKI